MLRLPIYSRSCNAPADPVVCCDTRILCNAVSSQTKAYADAEDAEFQLAADLEERGGMEWPLFPTSKRLEHPERAGSLQSLLLEYSLGSTFGTSTHKTWPSLPTKARIPNKPKMNFPCL